MAAEATAEPPPTSKEAAKLLADMEEEEKLDRNRIMLIVFGYVSLLFAGLALFFPLWNEYAVAPYDFVSLWRITPFGVPLYYWEILWYYELFWDHLFTAIIFLHLLGIVLILVIKSIWNAAMHDWKKPVPRTSFFWICIITAAMIVLLSFYTPGLVEMSSQTGYFTVIYGPTWGLGFGWYSLLIAGILAIIQKKIKDAIEKEKEEEKEGYLT